MACTSQELLGGSHCAFTSPCSLRGGEEKVPPFLYFPLEPTQWLSVRGLGKAGVSSVAFDSAPPSCRWGHVASTAAHSFTTLAKDSSRYMESLLAD